MDAKRQQWKQACVRLQTGAHKPSFSLFSKPPPSQSWLLSIKTSSTVNMLIGLSAYFAHLKMWSEKIKELIRNTAQSGLSGKRLKTMIKTYQVFSEGDCTKAVWFLVLWLFLIMVCRSVLVPEQLSQMRNTTSICFFNSKGISRLMAFRSPSSACVRVGEGEPTMLSP